MNKITYLKEKKHLNAIINEIHKERPRRIINLREDDRYGWIIKPPLEYFSHYGFNNCKRYLEYLLTNIKASNDLIQYKEETWKIFK